MRQIAIALSFILTATTSAAATFCPWKILGEAKPERFINLTVVQYVDIADDELRVSFGGGNFGSGYDVKIAIKTREDGLKILKAMQETAKQCDRV
ncbi:hypothetical protein [Deefgea rivuli]|uniref:hypothetical protein n=1 Tax=Deefgea rivuli TaxID=400948 RepID=UPI0004846AED|nr:hypothetical protein [Deefgea rivuli]